VTKPSLLAVDPDVRSARALADAFTKADVRFRCVPDVQRAVVSLRAQPTDAVLAVGDLGTALITELLAALVQDPRLSSLPVFLLTGNAIDAALVGQLRTGVVEMLARPFSTFEHPARVKQVLADLPERTGRVVGFEALRMVEHIQRTFRSGALKIHPGTPGESLALFTNGVLRGARCREARGETALAAMLALPRAPWAFVPLSGEEGEGAGVVIELGEGPPPKAPAPAPPAAEAYDLLEGELPEVELSPVSVVPAPAPPPAPIAMPPARKTTSPRAADEEGEELVLEEPVTPTPTPPPPHTPILLVDDDGELCRMFATLFRHRGFAVTTAPDGMAGYEAALGGGFELLIADLNMPRMDGWGLLRLIRDDYRTRELPFAMLSCQDDYRESLKALDAGAQAYFPKTLRLDALVTHVQSLLQPRAQFRGLLGVGRVGAIPLGQLGVQWVLRELGAAGLTGRLRAKDSWASYEVIFRNGAALHASAQTGSHQAVGERALNALVASRCTEATWTGGDFGTRQTLMLPVPNLLARATQLLNENAKKLRDGLMVNPLEIHVNPELYQVYVRNGPPQWLPAARLLCEQGLPPREVLARLNDSPIELEEVLRDLIRRGVVSLSAPPA
jgi:DNA-binding response OmpR family regulator